LGLCAARYSHRGTPLAHTIARTGWYSLHTRTFVHTSLYIRVYIAYGARAYVCTYPPPLSLCRFMQLRCIGVGKTGGGAIFVVVWEVREITSGERGSRATSGETRRGEKHGNARGGGREGVYADIRVSPVTAILRKTFDLFAHAVANPEERLIPTCMLGMPRRSAPLLPSPTVHPGFILRRIRSRPKTFRYPADQRFSSLLRLAKIHNGVGARPILLVVPARIMTRSPKFFSRAASLEIDMPNCSDSKGDREQTLFARAAPVVAVDIVGDNASRATEKNGRLAINVDELTFSKRDKERQSLFPCTLAERANRERGAKRQNRDV